MQNQMSEKNVHRPSYWRKMLSCFVVLLMLLENESVIAFTSNHHNAQRIYSPRLVVVVRQSSSGEDEAASGSVRKLVKEKVKRLAKSVWGNGAARFSTPSSELLEKEASFQGEAALCLDEISLQKTNVADALRNAELAIMQSEEALKMARSALQMAKEEAGAALQLAETAARQASETAERATELAISSAKTTDAVYTDLEGLTYDDVDYHLCEMAPPFLDDSQCLVPGEPVVRVEKAPENSRRIFAGIDIPVSVDRIWGILTDYEHLQNVVPNLVVNEVLEYYNYDDSGDNDDNSDKEDSEENVTDNDVTGQCRSLASKMKGSKLRQVGGAKVVGINFSARTTLEVREWPNGLPDFAHFEDEKYDGLSRQERYKLYQSQKLERYKFPRPFALTQLPHKDISMQSIENDDGEFRMYQGVWRMQSLPGCTPQSGGESMRLSYAVEISPRPYLPVGLIEGRISQDLCNNLIAIRKYVTEDEQ